MKWTAVSKAYVKKTNMCSFKNDITVWHSIKNIGSNHTFRFTWRLRKTNFGLLWIDLFPEKWFYNQSRSLAARKHSFFFSFFYPSFNSEGGWESCLCPVTTRGHCESNRDQLPLYIPSSQTNFDCSLEKVFSGGAPLLPRVWRTRVWTDFMTSNSGGTKIYLV